MKKIVTTTMKMSDYPWSGLSKPRPVGEYIAKLVSNDINPKSRRIFWAKSWSGHPVLLVEYNEKPWKKLSLPTLKNIAVIDHKEENCISLELLDVEMQDIFYKVCIDIIGSLQSVSDATVKKACLLRLERWTYFLKPSRDLLSLEEQKGLIAELFFLKRNLLTTHDEESALEGWTGPDAGARDFACGQVFVEVKSKRSSANTCITISSEEQLNTNDSEKLFLYVVEINNVPSDSGEGFTVSDVVKETREAIASPIHKVAFDNKLANVGYFEEDDYSNQKWSEGGSYYYAVIDDFPKIDSKLCSPGVSRVKYQINLDFCNEFLVDRDTVLSLME